MKPLAASFYDRFADRHFRAMPNRKAVFYAAGDVKASAAARRRSRAISARRCANGRT